MYTKILFHKTKNQSNDQKNGNNIHPNEEWGEEERKRRIRTISSLRVKGLQLRTRASERNSVNRIYTCMQCRQVKHHKAVVP